MSLLSALRRAVAATGLSKPAVASPRMVLPPRVHQRLSRKTKGTDPELNESDRRGFYNNDFPLATNTSALSMIAAGSDREASRSRCASDDQRPSEVACTLDKEGASLLTDADADADASADDASGGGDGGDGGGGGD